MTDGDLTTAQARALGAPTRQAIVAYLDRRDVPVTVAELSAHLGLNHNGVRKHLAQLVAARLVVEEREARTAPGRPKLLYRLTPTGPAAAEQPYRRLAVLLATALASGADPAAVGRQAAAAMPAPAVAAAPVGGSAGAARAPVDALADRFAAEGFEPRVRRGRGRADIVLGRCPFAAAAEAAPEAVCRLHLGLARGAAESIGGLRVEGLAARDPRQAGCRLTVSEVAAGGLGDV